LGSIETTLTVSTDLFGYPMTVFADRLTVSAIRLPAPTQLEVVAHGEHGDAGLVLDFDQGDLARNVRSVPWRNGPAPALRHVNGDVFGVVLPDRSAAIA
jgi:hypothetical protein